MLEFKDGRYFVGIWYVHPAENPVTILRLGQVDWLGGLWRDAADGLWEFAYRFRYYSPECSGPFDETDRKSWFHFRVGKPGVTSQEVTRTIEAIARATAERNGTRWEFVPIESDVGADAMKALEGREWCHRRREGGEQQSQGGAGDEEAVSDRG